jgi:hypothetical protein
MDKESQDNKLKHLERKNPKNEPENEKTADEDYEDLGQQEGKKRLERLKIHDDDSEKINDHVIVGTDDKPRTKNTRQNKESGEGQRE